MKILWLILSVWTGGDGNDLYVFDKPSFETEPSCVSYVKENFFMLNNHVNWVHESHGDVPNLFFCISRQFHLLKNLSY